MPQISMHISRARSSLTFYPTYIYTVDFLRQPSKFSHKQERSDSKFRTSRPGSARVRHSLDVYSLHDRKRWNSSSRRCGSSQRHSAKRYSINTDKLRLLGKQQTHAQTDEDRRTDRQTLAISCRSSTSISAWPLTCAQLTHVFAVGQMRSIF